MHNDLTFVDHVLDEDFARVHGLGRDGGEFAVVRENLLASLTNGGQPVIRVLDRRAASWSSSTSGAAPNCSSTRPRRPCATCTRLWAGPVRLRTRLESRAVLVSCTADGVVREYGEVLPGRP